MHARTIRASIVPGKMDEAIRIYRDEVLPVLQAQPGFVSTTVLVDPESHEGMVVTLWETEEAAHTTGPGSDYLAQQLARMRFVLVARHINHWDVPIAVHA